MTPSLTRFSRNPASSLPVVRVSHGMAAGSTAAMPGCRKLFGRVYKQPDEPRPNAVLQSQRHLRSPPTMKPTDRNATFKAVRVNPGSRLDPLSGNQVVFIARSRVGPMRVNRALAALAGSFTESLAWTLTLTPARQSMGYAHTLTFKARQLAVQRIGPRGGPSAIALSSYNTDFRKRKPLFFLASI